MKTVLVVSLRELLDTYDYEYVFKTLLRGWWNEEQ